MFKEDEEKYGNNVIGVPGDIGEKYEELNKKILNEIDFIPYMKKMTFILDIMDAVEKDNKELIENNDEVCEGFLFNWLSEEAVTDYLKERYDKNLTVYEETVTRFFVEYNI